MMTDEELCKALRDRAVQERLIQANNLAVATALKGQRLLFDQGHRSPSLTYTVRMAVDHENCAKNDANLAADWDAAADRIEALVKELEVSCEIGRAFEEDAGQQRTRAEAAEAALKEAYFAGWADGSDTTSVTGDPTPDWEAYKHGSQT